MKEVEVDKTVVEMARTRLKNVFDTSPKVYLNVSGGKDSICLMHLVWELVKENEQYKKKLVVRFIDEEAMFEDVINIVKQWRKKFLSVGVEFQWFCVQVKHFNCLNTLESDESFICWDANKKDKWVRQPPDFAIPNHPLLKERKDNYQSFLTRISQDGIVLIGVRTAESLHRLINLRTLLSQHKNGISKEDRKAFPIYDWNNQDVWLYISENNLDFPKTYIHLYQIGTHTNQLRISMFFSIDTARVLNKLEEFEPGLMKKVTKREPNAYLVSLYWDTNLFRRPTTKTNNKEEDIDYKKQTFKLLNQNRKDSKHLNATKNIDYIIKHYSLHLKPKHWKKCYLILLAGDVKNRAIRALEMSIFSEQRKEAKNELAKTRD